ncbi:hypothetical protein BH11PSE6_BH11PSE6_28270 [soil metagenome]
MDAAAKGRMLVKYSVPESPGMAMLFPADEAELEERNRKIRAGAFDL